jgi:hypothetical protein
MKLDLFADYHQLHVQDEGTPGDFAEAWTAQAVDDRIAAIEDGLAIGMREATTVRVELAVLDAEPPDDSAEQDHVTRAAIHSESGRLAVLGCSDYLPDAARLALPRPGAWEARVSHRGLARGKERIRVQLWPSSLGRVGWARVDKRWTPPAPAARGKRPVLPKDAKKAAQLARQGHPDEALEALLRFAAESDVAAAASAAELLAFRGRWADLVPWTTALLAQPRAVHAGNVFTDMASLVRRAAKELGDASLIARAAAVVPEDHAARRDAVLLQDAAARMAERRPERRATYEDAAREAASGKRFQGKPDALAAHCFALAETYGVEDALIARWEPPLPWASLQHAVPVARALVRRERPAEAWAVLESKLPAWFPVDAAQVAPVELLVDPLLSGLMTSERCEQVLRTPRAPEAAHAARKSTG